MSENIQKYEDAAQLIDQLLKMRASSWKLHAISWFDYDDVSQKIRIHINKQWSKWDQSRPIRPWLNTVITRQIINEIRNHYKNFARPCLDCKFNDGGDLCSSTKTGLQCSECPLYQAWEKGKKRAYNVKLPLAIENHENEIADKESLLFDLSDSTEKLHKEMQKALSVKQFGIYKLLFIEKIPEEKVARILKLTTNEPGRKAGYKQIMNFKNKFLLVAKKIIENKDII